MEAIISRRYFMQRGTLTAAGAKLALMGAAGGAVLTLDGCNVVTDLEHWIPVGRQGFNLVLAFLEDAGILNPVVGGVINGAVALVQAAFNQLDGVVQQYKAINPPPAGIVQKIVAGLNLLAGNFQSFLTSINISDTSIAKYVARIADLILTTIAGFEALFPSLAKGTLVPNRTFSVAGQTATFVPKERTIRAYKKDHNSIMRAAGHPELTFHISFFQHL
jgi:hypothetical protein